MKSADIQSLMNFARSCRGRKCAPCGGENVVGVEVVRGRDGQGSEMKNCNKKVG